MSKKKFWAVVAGIMLAVAGIFWLTLCPRAWDWPYYKATVAGGFTTESDMWFRLGHGETAHLQLGKGVELEFTTSCLPRESGGFQPCHLRVVIHNPNSLDLNFAGGQFIIRDPQDLDVRYGFYVAGRTLNRVPLWGRPIVYATLYLDYKLPPREFMVVVPDLQIDGVAHKIPPFYFKYTEVIQCVPLLINF